MASLGTNARALFNSYYTDERMLNTYMQLYFCLLEEKCPDQTGWIRHGSGLKGTSGLASVVNR